MNTTYGSGVSTAYPKEAATGLPAKFGYIVKYYGYRDYPNEQDARLWKEVVFRELSAGRPVLYGGTSYKNGEANYFSHSFVIDGYDKQGRVHVNYGYGGKGDGYFPIDKLPMKFDGWDETFDTYQTLVVIHRPQDGEIDYTLQAHSKAMNMRRFIFILIVSQLMSLACFAANKTIKGHVADEFGKNVEFASVYVDSIYAVSDKEGNFSLVVRDGMKQELVVSHIQLSDQ